MTRFKDFLVAKDLIDTDLYIGGNLAEVWRPKNQQVSIGNTRAITARTKGGAKCRRTTEAQGQQQSFLWPPRKNIHIRPLVKKD